ncbi:MAG: hypothetical protein CL927_10090 [Deltaproteobacteria bacterium]|nr:hypothetical protein [Deltaproteobacteria bacterium]
MPPTEVCPAEFPPLAVSNAAERLADEPLAGVPPTPEALAAVPAAAALLCAAPPDPARTRNAPS